MLARCNNAIFPRVCDADILVRVCVYVCVRTRARPSVSNNAHMNVPCEGVEERQVRADESRKSHRQRNRRLRVPMAY